MPETDAKELYIVSRFLQYAYQENRPLFEDFIVLVKGQMYANALTCPDLQSLEQKFNNVTFYLDTPVVLNLLGLQGQGEKQAASELTSLILELKGTLAVFEHTLDETKGVIRYALEHFDDPRATPRILREVRKSGIGLSDLILCLDQIRERLSAHHVVVKPAPAYQPSFQIDEHTFQAALEDEVRYPSENTLLNDINSVRCIYALRRDVEPSRLEDAVAVFVTSNVLFARVAFEFGKTHNSSKEVSSVVTDYSMANVAWLKAPMKRPLLPEKETLALCYAALEPSRELFRKYVETMDGLRETGQISEQEHAVLRLSPAAHRGLMDLTLGDEAALTGVGLQQILERLKESMVAEHKKASTQERTAIQQQLGEQRNLYAASESERGRLTEEHSAVLLIASRRARLLAKGLTVTAMAIFSVILLLGAAAGSGLLSAQSVRSVAIRSFIWAFVSIAVCWGWYSWLNGTTLGTLTMQIEYRMTLKFFAWFTGRKTLP